MQLLDPMLRDFHFDRFSEIEQAKYIEEAKRIEEEQLHMASVISQEKEGEHQGPTDQVRMAVDHCELPVYPPVLGTPGHSVIYCPGPLDEGTFAEYIWRWSMEQGKDYLESYIEPTDCASWIKRLLDQKKVTPACMSWTTPRGDKVEDQS